MRKLTTFVVRSQLVTSLATYLAHIRTDKFCALLNIPRFLSAIEQPTFPLNELRPTLSPFPRIQTVEKNRPEVEFSEIR